MSVQNVSHAPMAAGRSPRLHPVLALLVLIALVVGGIGVWIQWPRLREGFLERQSVAELKTAAARPGADALTALVLGRKLAAARQRADAVNAFGDGLRRLQTRDDRKLRARLDGELALNLMLLGDDRTALPYLKKALELDRTNTSAQMAMGWLLTRREDPAAAVQQFQIVTQLDPRHAPAWAALGGTLLQARKLPEAEAAFRKAMALEPRAVGSILGLGTVLAAQSRWEDAEQTFQRALRVAPQHPEALLALARVRTLKAKTAEEYRQARKELEPLMAGSRDASFLLHLGVLDAQFGDLPEAERHLKRSIELDPANPESSYALSRVYRRQKRDREARETLERFQRMERLHRRIVQLRKRLDQKPQDLPMNLELARCLEERGEWSEAARQYQQVLQLSPNHPGAAQRLAAVERKLAQAFAAPQEKP